MQSIIGENRPLKLALLFSSVVFQRMDSEPGF
jgi:hypothetical protein